MVAREGKCDDGVEPTGVLRRESAQHLAASGIKLFDGAIVLTDNHDVAIGRVLAPSGEIVIGIDDTIERRWGHKIAARGIYRDPVRSPPAPTQVVSRMFCRLRKQTLTLGARWRRVCYTL